MSVDRLHPHELSIIDHLSRSAWISCMGNRETNDLRTRGLTCVVPASKGATLVKLQTPRNKYFLFSFRGCVYPLTNFYVFDSGAEIALVQVE